VTARAARGSGRTSRGCAASRSCWCCCSSRRAGHPGRLHRRRRVLRAVRLLITGLLLREHERWGAISLSAFYARRARRLLPAAAVALVGTLIFASLFAAPLDLPEIAADTAAAAASVANIRFAIGATDYFAADISRSPLLHYWSLGVEEQFYVVWPALLILATRRGRPRFGTAVVLGVVTLLSFVAAFVLTEISPPWAFYSLPTRAWQLGVGGLLAAGALAVGRIPTPLASLGAWAGLAAVVASALVIDPTTPYPGSAALVPTLGTAALILGGERRGSPGALLSATWLRFFGRISYSLYLVHWPILVLPAATLAIGAELPLAMRLALGLVSIGVGYLSYRFVEAPFHHGRRLLGTPRRTLAIAGAAIAATLAFSVNIGADATRRLDDPNDPGLTASAGGPGPVRGAGGEEPPPPAAEEPPPDDPELGEDGTPPPDFSFEPGEEPGPGEEPAPGEEPGEEPSGEPTPSREPGATPGPTPEPTPRPVIRLPRDLRPPLSRARTDMEPLDRDRCTLQTLQSTPTDCVYGDRNGSRTVVLLGDSHAAQWFPPIEQIAKEKGWRLLPHTKVSCRFVDMEFMSRTLQRLYHECFRWREAVIEKLRRIKPDLVIVTVARALKPASAADDDPRRQGEAAARLLKQIPGKKVILVDTPQSRVDPPACLSANKADVRRCTTTWSRAFSWRYLLLEKSLAKSLGGSR
jgi:peptidoglycan/LPS O-acetylase OafA/YrhL